MNIMVVLQVLQEQEPSFWAKHLFDILTIGIGLAFTIALYIWASFKKSHQLRMYIPTIWTSLGILFTFVSIYRGLTDKELLELVKAGHIDNLIDRIIPAFSTSIIGIIGAIGFSVLNKGLLAQVEDESTEAFDRLRRQMGFEKELTSDSPELLLFKLISAVNQNGDAIYKQIDKKAKDSTDTANNKSQEIYDNLAKLLRELKDESNTARSTDLSKQNTSFQEAVKSMMDAFNDALSSQNDTLSKKMDSLENTLKKEIEDIQRENRGLIGQLVEAEKQLLKITGENLGKESAERNQQLQDFISEQKGLYQEIKEGLEDAVSDIRKLFEEDVQKSVEKFAQDQHELSTTTIAEWNKNLTEKSNEYLKSFEDSIGKLPEAMSKKLDELHEKENNLIEATIKENQGNISTLLEENKAAIKTIAVGIKDDYEKIKEELENSQERWKEQATQIEKENLDKIQTINSDVEGKVKAINDAITTLGERLQNAFNGIKSQIENSITENTTNFNSLLDANKKSIEKVSDEIKSDNESIKIWLTETNQNWKEEVKRVNQDAAKEIQDIQTKIASIEESLRVALGEITEEIKQSISDFINKQNEVKEYVSGLNKNLTEDLSAQIRGAFPMDELQTANTKLVDGIKDTLNKFDSNTKSISSNLTKIKEAINSSSEKYAEVISTCDNKISYVEGLVQLIQGHITEIAVLENALKEWKKTVSEFKELKDKEKKQTGK